MHRSLTVRRRSPTRTACDGPFSPAHTWRKTWSTLRALAADPGCLASPPAGIDYRAEQTAYSDGLAAQAFQFCFRAIFRSS